MTGESDQLCCSLIRCPSEPEPGAILLDYKLQHCWKSKEQVTGTCCAPRFAPIKNICESGVAAPTATAPRTPSAGCFPESRGTGGREDPCSPPQPGLQREDSECTPLAERGGPQWGGLQEATVISVMVVKWPWSVPRMAAP